MSKKINKKNLTLRIHSDVSRITAIKQINDALDTYIDVIRIDLLDASFPISRDFLLVLSKRFSSDRYILRVADKKTKLSARSLGIQAEVAGLRAEFDRQYSSGNLATHNMGMFEYFWYELRRGIMYIWFILFGRKKKEKKLPHYKKYNGQIFLITLGLFISILLLLFIFHIAVSKTTVTVRPQIMVESIPANVTYKIMTGSLLEGDNVMQMKKLKFPVEASMRFSVKTIDPESSIQARGIITVYNELTVNQELRPSTRFITEKGIVFRSLDWVRIPKSHTVNGLTEMGTAEIEVVADNYDSAKRIIGDRGNILAGTDLTIPGLKFNRDKVYAKAKMDFVGGKNPSRHQVTEKEVEGFQKTLLEKIKKIGIDITQEKIQNNDPEVGGEYMLFADGISFSDVKFDIVSGQKYGDFSDEIEIKGTAQLTAIIIDKKATIDYLTRVFRDKILQGTEKELGIHDDTLRISSVLSRAKDGMSVRATMELDASKSFDFENNANELVKSMKKKILNLPIEKAKEQLIRDGYVQEVEIQSSPFWLKNVSSNIDNVDFKIRQ
ncbi:hypothetical protein KGV55_01135 [Candidatus Gracilibacteria bacterium]|nr:hypothetical protein [Candidatus Gracilibacteria bacterium]